MSNQHEEKNIQYRPVRTLPMTSGDDGIDLLELLRMLMSRKWIVLGVTFFCIFAGVGFALLATPVYETEAYFLPPATNGIEELNINDITVNQNKAQYTPEIVYQTFLQNLRSRELRRKFFKQENLLFMLKDSSESVDEERIFEKKFNEVLLVNKASDTRDKNESFYSLRFEGKDASRIAEVTNNFVAMVMKYTRDQLVADVMTLKENQIRYFEKSIASKIKIGVQEKKDSVFRLKEALDIANKLRITEDKFSGSDVEAATTYNIEVSYLRGTKTLNAQIESLQNRKNDEPFIEGLRELQEKLYSISSTVINPETIQVAQIDQPALVSDKPFKPRKHLIVTLAGVFGFFLGSFIVFLLNFVQRVRKEEA